MFKFVVLVAFLGLAAAAPQDDSAAQITAFENVISPEGDSFRYAFQTSNGIEFNSAGDASAIAGSYKYVSPEGQPIELSYTADEEGFRPVGDHLPTPPPAPV